MEFITLDCYLHFTAQSLEEFPLSAFVRYKLILGRYISDANGELLPSLGSARPSTNLQETLPEFYSLYQSVSPNTLSVS